MGRACPEWEAEQLLTGEERLAARMVARKRPPDKIFTLCAALHTIARFGSPLGRNGGG